MDTDGEALIIHMAGEDGITLIDTVHIGDITLITIAGVTHIMDITEIQVMVMDIGYVLHIHLYDQLIADHMILV